MWCIHSSFAPHLYDICDLIFILAYVGAPKPPILHQHIDCICNYIIELGMLVPTNHFFLDHIQVKFASYADAI